jgi:hypothetical protein
MTEHELRELIEWRHQNDTALKNALRLVNPAARSKTQCLDQIESALLHVQLTYDIQKTAVQPKSKAARKAARDLEGALKRVELMVKKPELDWAIRRYFPHGVIKEWRERCEHASQKRTSEKRPERPSALAKKTAAAEAFFLMFNHSSDPDRFSAAKGSKLCRLAAILFGYANAKLHNQCTLVVRDLKKFPTKKKSGSI